MDTAQVAGPEVDALFGYYDALLLESYGLTSAEIAIMTAEERAEVVHAFEDAIASVKTAIQARLGRRSRTAQARRKAPNYIGQR